MNMKFAALATLGSLAAFAAAPDAQAADNGFYLGAGVTQTNFKIDDTEGDLDDNSFKLIAGFRPLDWLAFEANYIDLGSADEDGIELDTNAVTLSGLALAEFGIVDVYARLGVARVSSDIDVNLGGGARVSDSDEKWEPTYGVGVGVHFGSIGVRAEYERFNTELFDNANLDADVDTVSLSVTYTFL